MHLKVSNSSLELFGTDGTKCQANSSRVKTQGYVLQVSALHSREYPVDVIRVPEWSMNTAL